MVIPVLLEQPGSQARQDQLGLPDQSVLLVL